MEYNSFVVKEQKRFRIAITIWIIKLLSQTMKVLERMVEVRIKNNAFIFEKQFIFSLGRMTRKVIHQVRRFLE